MRLRNAFATAVALLIAAVLAPTVLAQVSDYTQINYPKIPKFKIERPETFTLPNGMQVFLMVDHELPLINVDARIRTGSNFEPADKTGLTSIFGQVQREGGTSKMTGDQIDDFLEARAASIETSVGGDSGFASMDCLKQDFDAVFALFSDVLRNPAFAEDKIELAKVQENTGIARRNDDIAGIVGREFSRLVYGADSPLGRLTQYTTVAAVGRGDLVDWHKKYYHPNNVLLGVVGDFDPAQMKAKITAQFKDWNKGPALPAQEVAYDKNPKPGVYFIEKDDVTQAYVRMGHLGISTRNPDYHAVQVMNEVLGGSFASRLFSNVRSEKGLAYSVFGGVFSSLAREGICQVGLSTKSSTMGQSVDALREEMSGIINNPVTDNELKRAKDSILNSFVFNYDSKREILSQQLTYAYFGYPADFLEQYRDKIDSVTREDVTRVARKYVQPDKAALLVVGKSADFDRPVESFGPVTTIDISIPPPPDTRAKVTKSPTSLAEGAKLFSRAAKSVNGKDANKIESVQTKVNMAISMQGQQMTLGQEVWMTLPDKVHVALNTPMGTQTIVINGGQGYMAAGGQQQPLPQTAVDEALKQLSRELVVLASQLGNPDLETVSAGRDAVDGAACDVVSVTLNGSESRLCVDPSGKVLKQTFQGKHPFTQTPGQVELTYADYRAVDGRMLPFKQVLRFDGDEVSTSTFDSITINPDLDAALFEVPTGG